MSVDVTVIGGVSIVLAVSMACYHHSHAVANTLGPSTVVLGAIDVHCDTR